ncbi:molybdopterin-dependent oxidoreductase [Steroidobacter sp. S1-65]|uniref:Molybdopterin-dependent oxidoreductase n=1 Tax=Steroidobacter gossypii TaxID=2805490 RepID=A0ABS1WW08_9GAMM|nr:nitrate reductase [Steroidobacter gossypii]MBM0105166.1 molybdopterin-dependent oxidoreductase [Steroidobacter gossypii]
MSINTTCPYCGVGCGVIAQVDAANNIVSIAGDPAHPANFGRLCSKGSALGQTLGSEGRLLYPRINGQRASMNAALDHVAAGFQRVVDEHGPDAVALYVSGQLLTEDYYVANKLMKGFIGTANIDTNSRLCMSSAVSGHKRAFGEDLVPVCYEDLELADLIVLVGSNTAWCHPVLYQRIAQAKQQRPGVQIVVIDPRRTMTCEIADLHLPVRGGSDVWLFNGLLAYLHQQGHTAHDFVTDHTEGLDEALQAALASAGDLEGVAAACGIHADRLLEFYRLFASRARVVTAFSMGVNQSTAGTDKVNSIINCHLLTGRIGQPGAGPFSITGQPNAMGGREVGGLATMLAAHMDIEDARHRELVQRFWRSPRMVVKPGLKAVELFDAIHDGKVKAVWIMATNPVVSLPDADKVKAALRRCELVVVSDCFENTDTNEFAHVLLPAAGWGEKDGTVTNSERRISRQRAFQPLSGEARPDWWLICEVARRLGFDNGFNYDNAHEIFLDHAALSKLNSGERAFDIGGLAKLTSAEYDALEPVQWPVPARGHAGTPRLLQSGRFYRRESKARFVPTAPRAPVNALQEEFPWVLNTGRIRDQWHTMTRTGRAPTLASHLPEPYIDMHAQDALLSAVSEGQLARVETQWGALVARVKTSGEMPRGMVFVPIHWNGANASDARVGALVNPVVDPVSGEPEFKHTPARVTPFTVNWHGFVLARTPLPNLDTTWWTAIRGEHFMRYEIAGRGRPPSADWAHELLHASSSDADWIEYSDPASGVFRGVLLIEERIAGCVFISPRTDLPSRAWLSSLFAKRRVSDKDRVSLLNGGTAAAADDPGPMVCSCFGVGRNTLCKAIARERLATPQDVGRKLKAGTNCGSCLPEIRQLLAQ